MNIGDSEACKEFLAALHPFGEAYEYVTVKYLAGRKSEAASWGLLQAIIELRDAPALVDQPQFESRHLRAGIVSLTGAQVQPVALMKTVLSGRIPVDQESLVFSEQHGGGYQLQALRAQPSDNRRQCSAGLRLTGGSVQQVAEIYQLGWELLGADPPFESIPEIVRAYSLGEWQQYNSCVEIWMTPVLHFTGATHLKGEQAEIGIRLAKSLDSNRVT